MADDKKANSGSLNKAMKSMGALEVRFAQLRVGMSGKDRLKVYNNINFSYDGEGKRIQKSSSSKTHKFALYKQKKKDYNPCGKRKERRTKT